MRMLERYYDTITQDMPDEVKRQIVAVDITGASKWFYEESEQNFWDWEEDFATILPPWEVCWLEFVPSKVHRISKNQYVDADVGLLDNVGFLVTRIEVDDARGIEMLEQDYMIDFLRMRAHAAQNPEGLLKRREAINKAVGNGFECKYLMVILQFLANKHGIVKNVLSFYLDKWGKPISIAQAAIGDPQMARRIRQLPPGEDRDYIERQVGEGIAVLSFPMAFAFSLMHCKNVTLDDIHIPYKVATKRQKKGIPTITFKTLVIDPMRRQTKRESAEGDEIDTVKKALHVCRGHFKDYRQSGLFGKLFDIYWWEQHLRGSSDNGVVVKDYAVKGLTYND